jgi:hypothetical protein
MSPTTVPSSSPRIFPIDAPPGVLARLMATDLPRDYLVWDAFTEGKPRVDLRPLVLSEEQHQRAVHAAESTYLAVARAREVALSEHAEAEHYGFHPDVLGLALAGKEAVRGSMARVDLLLRSDGSFVSCEVNADCPGGHNEALGLPILARQAGFSRAMAPPCAIHALVDRLARLAKEHDSPVGLLFSTAYAEDLQVCALVERELRVRGVRTLRLGATALRVQSGDVYAWGERVAVMYRYLPLEYMEGLPVASALARAIAQGRLCMVSDTTEIFPQSKLAFARAQALGVSAQEACMSPTFDLRHTLDAELSAPHTNWVVKRALGRVGDQVFVGPLHTPAEWALVLKFVRERVALGERWLAQHFVPQQAVATPLGPLLLTLGVYLLQGKFAGYFARLSEDSLATHDALAVPVFLEAA